MKNMECLKCGYEFEGWIGDECPKCKADNKQVIDKKETKNNFFSKWDKLIKNMDF